VNHILICGAAGYTNLGDDAILWGMLTQLRPAVGGRAIRVAGGPGLAPLLTPFGAAPVSYVDRPELARAVEEAGLVILGGGGMLYDVDYEASLARFFGDPADRPWLYELAQIAAAARVAARPLMLYGMGAGPLVTEAARRAARYVAEQASVVTVRDTGSADLLAECGVPRAHVQVAGDPALAVAPGSAESAESFLRATGIAARPRPWIALNLRPWHRLGRPEDQARTGELVGRLTDRLAATVVLMPFQQTRHDDREVLGAALEAAGKPANALLVAPPPLPPDLAAVLARFDLVVGMRLHSLMLAMNGAVPFVGLCYDPKVAEFAREAGLGEYLHGVDELDPESVAASCQRLLSRRAEASALLAQRNEQMRTAAGLSAELAAWLLARRTGLPQAPRLRGARPAAAPRPERPPRVLMQIRADYQDLPGGDTVQMTQTRRALEELGVRAEVSTEEAPDLSAYDLVHTFNLGRPGEPYRHCLNAMSQGKPVALSTVYADFGEMWEWGDSDYWELPPPEVGLPVPRRAPPVGPVEARRRMRLEEQRQAAIDWATVYLPNGQGEADWLHAAHGMDLNRTVVVPNAVADIFFDARPEAFVARCGLRDFVLCAARVEKRKNQLSLVAALRGTGLPLVILGWANPEAYRDLCRRYADENVRFIDGLAHEELPSAYAAARVHVLAGWFETPGLSTLEAAAAGCNVVSTDRGLAREYFGDLAWYCDPGRIESIREAVLAAYQAPRSDRLRDHVRQHYTWRHAAERTLEAYQLALALHQSGSDRDRQPELLAAARRHADWLARLAADRQYEADQLRQWASDLDTRRKDLEAEVQRLQRELELVTSRRLYRWSESVGRAGWGLLRALRIKR
jgi:polysaccharide pyruvyl transferase CsaB